jgi:hypothetical protein
MLTTRFATHQKIFALFALTYVALAIIGAFRSYSPVPYWDMWDGYIQFYVRVLNSDWSVWWAQHNEHRIFLARLFFWLDLSFFDGLSWFLIIVNYTLLFIACLTFLTMWREKSGKGYNFGYLFLTAWIFSWVQNENLTWGFQSQFILAQLLPLLAFYFIHLSTNENSKKTDRNFYLAIFFGCLSIGSMANGVLALPLLTIYALVSKAKRERVGILILASIVCLFFYFYGYVAVQRHGSIMLALKNNPIDLFKYITLYIGGPFYYIGKGEAGLFFAFIAGLLFFILTLFKIKEEFSNAWKSSFNLALIFFIFYIAGTALGTGGGRLIFGIEQALSSRYMTPALMAWAALFILFSSNVLKCEKCSTIISALVLILLLPYQLKALQFNHDENFQRKVAALALEMRVKDQDQVTQIYPSLENALAITELPVKNNFSIFGTQLLKNVNEKLNSKIVLKNIGDIHTKCIGHIDEVTSIKNESNYNKIKGWVFNSITKNVPPSLWVLNGKNEIIGYVITGQSRNDVRDLIDPSALRSGFIGYISQNYSKEFISLYDPSSKCIYIEDFK